MIVEAANTHAIVAFYIRIAASRHDAFFKLMTFSTPLFGSDFLLQVDVTYLEELNCGQADRVFARIKLMQTKFSEALK
ncbi:hypothetical protein [Undibacterium flavidum]|uniref:Uncharacterized protein n=1 Tax=Undibacterium flavidum TaxID=2762297 RepID=A0ABR6Y8J9_9BURK|nr:hypothetical protein [Undibacterium flavidum]MBC3872926.1 hypothetical protein [Undibacterium flavidum]